MPRRLFPLVAALLILCAAAAFAVATAQNPDNNNNNADANAVSDTSDTTAPGALEVIAPDGTRRAACPLKHTDVRAQISGFLSRVTVTQEFENPFKEKIEAVYSFPLPQAAAVDDMTMRVGERTVRGRILRREEAQAVYEAARAGGQVASLLDQERPNIFTQSVANIMPGERVLITISYVETLKYEDGEYEFSFPTVVGPRYIPGTPTGTRTGGGRLPDTTQVPDASRITPPVAAKGTRAGHDISIEVMLDAGVAVDAVRSTTHEVDIERAGGSRARVALKRRTEIPNRDFVLRYDAAGRKVSDAILTHRASDGRGGFFTLILQPPERVSVADVTPKELVFVIDTSGSMSGFPLEKAKEAMKHALDGLNPQDTFNLITFSGDTHILFPQPVPATRDNLAAAQKFLASRQGGGGTEMMKAIRAALDPSDSQAHIRVVCFMTDGYVGNDMEIISEVQKHPNARVFSFGIGSSVNRFLLDKMAEYGRGEVEYVSLNADGSAAARRFHERVRNPVLTDISIDWGGLPVADVYPKRIPDLFSAKPVVLTGRYTGAARGTVRLRGRMGGNHFEREIAVELPESRPEHDVLATLWARRRVDDLMSEDMYAMQRGANTRPDLTETITQLGIEYRLMTQFTSFVAVEEMTITDGGQPRRIEVPVDAPAGVDRDMAVGDGAVSNFALQLSPGSVRTSPSVVTFSGGVSVVGGGAAGGAGGGVGTGRGVGAREKTANAPAPKRGDAPRRTETQGRGKVLAMDRLSSLSDVALSPQEAKRQQLLTKLHTSVAAVIERLKNKDAPAPPDEAKFVRDGRAEVQVWLVDKTPEALEKLKTLGFEILLDPRSSKLVIGRIAVDKLWELTELAEVRFIAPQK
ncbi:MAG TPA: VIT and VWA domain-containing protein [Pyrinomonadaceae bacterium]|nr:VIT and VWA domain-containing protein [Pyrinomonadaceae bacterium]